MSTDAEDIALVQEFFAASQLNDIDRAMTLLADDVVYQNVPFPADHGKAAVASTLKMFGKLVTSFEVKMIHIAATNGVVLTERIDILSGRFIHLDIWVCGTFEIKDGKIVLWRDYFDLASATAKLLVGPLRKLLFRH